MRWARGLVLVFAIASAAGAAMIVRKAAKMPAGPPPGASATAVEVLVARRAIGAGELVEEKDLRWQAWPDAAIPEAAVARRAGAAAPKFQPAPARYPLLAGEPVSDSKLARPGDGSAMAALIAPGMRAIAVPIKDESAAGGLIQPHDRVDVLWTSQRADAGAGAPLTRTLLRGAKVLAAGKAPNAKSGGAAARTATLELTPEQARIVAGARTSGEISLALIPAAEIAALPQPSAAGEWDEQDKPVKIMKFGRQPAVHSDNRGGR